ncbi:MULTISPECIES: hypothetical protein [unclassified Spirosoma]|uniref:hypothetical protein n=1 Tax=unclassified Spirosoma TaxID=2621999 RepID=UPI00095BC380|nr:MULTISPECIES: hypothetical protein [unclassified Spirosoma]MBN8825635.1 hypothetical protein [Spirosoma sp.]OJW71663.1 MAG: hypothetical protein BGO59_27235 [Spirosoma sp. 48-14]
MKFIATSLLVLLISLLSCQTKNDPDPANASTNPDDCLLTKITYSATSYDIPTFDSRGLVTSIQSYENGAKTSLYTNVYDADGKITSQSLNGLNVRYVYSGTTLTKIQLLDPTAQSVLGEYAVTFDASGRISNLKVQNTVSAYSGFEGLNSTFTYDSQNNCTNIDLKDDQGRVLYRTVYSNFVAVRSHITKFKNQYINPYTSTVLENLQFAGPYKQPNTSSNHVELYSAFDVNNNYTGTLAKIYDYTYQRTANQSGMMAKRTYTTTGLTNESGTTTYEYSGCQ